MVSLILALNFLIRIIQTIFETRQLYINVQNFIHNIRIIYIVYIYNDSNSVQVFKNSIFQTHAYHALQT